MRKALWIGLSFIALSSPALAASNHGGGNNSSNQPPQDPYNFDNYARNPNVGDVSTTSQTIGVNGQVTSSSTTTYDRDHFGTDVQNTTLNANGTKTTYNQEIDNPINTYQPPLSGTTTYNYPNTNTGTGGGTNPNAQFVTGTTTSSGSTSSQPLPYYDVNANAAASTTTSAQSGSMGPVNPANSANVTPGFTSHASYNGN